MEPVSLSRSVEDYLKAVYALNEQGDAAGTKRLAQALDVQPGSVSGMVRRLAEEGLVRHEPYRGVRLTRTGLREALKIVRRHRIIESYLVERLGYGWEDVHNEAERLEHAASDDLVNRMAEALGNPSTDPHGAPIPTRAGEIDPTAYPRLDKVAGGVGVTVRSVPDHDPLRLRHFRSVGLVPGVRAVVQASARDGGDVELLLEGGDDPLTVPAEVAREVKVEEG